MQQNLGLWDTSMQTKVYIQQRIATDHRTCKILTIEKGVTSKFYADAQDFDMLANHCFGTNQLAVVAI
jgi:hypothetical protein